MTKEFHKLERNFVLNSYVDRYPLSVIKNSETFAYQSVFEKSEH